MLLDSVTIFGGSAGGASVTYLMASPLTKGMNINNFQSRDLQLAPPWLFVSGLVSKAIAESGTNLAPWSQPAHRGVAQKRARQLAENFDCFIANDWLQTIDCLRTVPARNITAAFYDFFVNIIKYYHFIFAF